MEKKVEKQDDKKHVVTFMCSGCGTMIPYSKLDNVKCKVCNSRIFYKCRNPTTPSLYISK